MAVPLPDIKLSPAVIRSASKANLELKYERTLSDIKTQPDLYYPIQCVSINSIQLETDETHTEVDDNFSQAASKEEMDALSEDVISRVVGLPMTKRFQVWQGHLVHLPGLKYFVPMSESGSEIRREWLRFSKATGSSDGSLQDKIERHEISEWYKTRMSNALKNTYETDVLENPVSSSLREPAFEPENVILGCSLLVPENFSAYDGTRAPVVLLSNGVSSSNADSRSRFTYQGPISWCTPSHGSKRRRSRLMSLDKEA
ncbi:hypothetical protein I302_107332 [Kwoniella bestiolae CBS 10118]|uniref:Uncharacterized protein n=1 Tax=Kwoniella bestiolae CBS 10118 TaxID=1296100 RepID=A0A1B9FYU3_9TREE|nr:hypothetical protein I302_06932 [Kwoniella bestiolae CBS 10118]OCF23946.1 hypothetical protein I302_06932 [Kwoniella bestiolae CBS 10118]